MIRKTFFWMHLVAGVAAGIVIFIMSLTGVLLTYERQILHWAEKASYVPVAEQTTPLPLEDLIGLARAGNTDASFSTLVVHNDKGAPVELRAGRSGSMALNPYTGQEMHLESPGMESFFGWVTGFHRWFNVQGEGRATARAITGASNLLFLFLIFSGMYLWLPSAYKWVMFRSRMFFNARATTSRARDYNWHHVFGFWSAIPLVVVVATATVFNYTWANNLVYQIYGEEPPVRGRGGPGPQSAEQAGSANVEAVSVRPMQLNILLERIGNEAQGWNELSLTLPAAQDTTLQVAVDYGNGAQPQLRENLEVDRTTGAVVSSSGFSDQSAGQRTRSLFRFLHTGEALGFWGQTIAGLVSLLSLLMVWTGFALAWRRLISPLFRKRQQT